MRKVVLGITRLHLMSIFRSFIAFAFLVSFIVSCGGNAVPIANDSLVKVDSAHTQGLQILKPDSGQIAPPSQNVEVKTFEAKDEKGKSTGWGYDLFVDGKRTIHQPIIPAVPGNSAFATEEDARKTGQLAADKMKITGSLPTVLVHDLDSLGIKHQ